MSRTTKISKDFAIETGNWTGAGGGVELTLTSACNSGYSGTVGSLTSDYKPIARGVGLGVLREGIDYIYGQYMDDPAVPARNIYDTGISGSFTGIKCFRIVENGSGTPRNIAQATGSGGMGLRIRAMNLSDTSVTNPPATECYVDPKTGKFAMPRPIFYYTYNTSLSPSSAGTSFIPTIQYSNKIPYAAMTRNSSGEYTFGAVKWSNGWGPYVDGVTRRRTYETYPFGDYVLNMPQGCVSCWVICHQEDDDVNSGLRLSANTLFYQFNGSLIISLNGHAHSGTATPWEDGNPHHIFFVWDQAKGLGSGRSVIGYWDGVAVVEHTGDITLGERVAWWQTAHVVGGEADTNYTRSDNLKIWNHVISAGPAFEYSAATADGYHSCYFSAANRKPLSVQVGGIYVPPVANTASTLTLANAAGASAVWSF